MCKRQQSGATPGGLRYISVSSSAPQYFCLAIACEVASGCECAARVALTLLTLEQHAGPPM